MKVGITSVEELAAYRYGSTRMNILSENVGRYKMVFRLFSFSACNPAKTEVSYDTTERRDWKKILHCTSSWIPA